MKKLNLFVPVMLCAFLFMSCENAQEAEVTEVGEVANPENAMTYTIDTAKSEIDWKGNKVMNIGDAHNGTVKLQGGEVMVKNGELAGGNFTINMTSIHDKDLIEAGEEESYNKLVGHLKSADFFDVEKFPTAKFEITKATKVDGEGGNNYMINGNMTIKDKTAAIEFPAKVDIDDNKVTGKADVIIDRSKFDVRYGSDTYFPDLAKDKVISNEIQLNIDLVATANNM